MPQRLGDGPAKFTPELKSPSVSMPFKGTYSQEDYAQQMIDEQKAAHVSPRKVFPQSFDLNDVRYWIEAEPAFSKQAVHLDDTPRRCPDSTTATPQRTRRV